ncbi:MAG: nucleoside triphosphate pyrophosphohydrolase family protein [Candidatus Portnoybacteria bacterium]|nr:nucleoside triphosphate pyrophosphohydrolase family protein [Candidatus Portnoybacteria bacterium]
MKKDKITSFKEYQRLCQKTAVKFKTKEKKIFTWGLGIAGEAGDVAGCIKKTFSHNNDQRVGIKENIGDTLWYAAMICNFFGWNLQDILEENVKKLQSRYPKGFTSKKAGRGGKRIDWNEK